MLVNERLKRKRVLQTLTKSELLDLAEAWRSMVDRADCLLNQAKQHTPIEITKRIEKFLAEPGAKVD